MGVDSLSHRSMPQVSDDLFDMSELDQGNGLTKEERKKKTYKMEIVWSNVIKFVILHLLAAAGLYSFVMEASWATITFTVITYIYAGLGITAGAHRLWAHRSFKAGLPLRLFLIVANCMATQNSIYVWVRDHRVHHKFSETDADPHNAKRGFFFAHMGWLMVRKHPEVIQKGGKIDLTDLEQDKLIMIQHRHYLTLTMVINLLIPTLVPWYLWAESMWVAYVCAVFRYVYTLHATWLVNSAAHLWGDRPYDVNINPSQNLVVSALALGEGFHNYHHVFPQDYSVSEWRYSLNFTTFFIDLMAWLGLAHDRKSISTQVVQNRIARTGPMAKEPRIEANFDY